MQGLAFALPTLTEPVGAAKFDEQWLTEVANDLVSKPGASLVLAGAHQPVVVQLIVYAINSALKNVGATLLVREFARNPKTNSILQLAGEICARPDQTAFHFRRRSGLQRAARLAQDREPKQPLDWADLQKKVPDVVRLGYHEDATSALSQWHVPVAHYLESWGDALTSDGAYLSIQPMILPLFGGLSEIELMNILLGGSESGRPGAGAGNISRDRAAGRFSSGVVEIFARRIRSARSIARQTAGVQCAMPGGLAHTLGAAPAPTLDSPEIVLVRSYAMDDGRYINNGWLQELPDPITKLTWDNAAL